MKRESTQALNGDLKAAVLQVLKSGSKHQPSVPTAWEKECHSPIPLLVLDDFQSRCRLWVLAVLAPWLPGSTRHRLVPAPRETIWIHPTVQLLSRTMSRSFRRTLGSRQSIVDRQSDPPKDQEAAQLLKSWTTTERPLRGVIRQSLPKA